MSAVSRKGLYTGTTVSVGSCVKRNFDRTINTFENVMVWWKYKCIIELSGFTCNHSGIPELSTHCINISLYISQSVCKINTPAEFTACLSLLSFSITVLYDSMTQSVHVANHAFSFSLSGLFT